MGNTTRRVFLTRSVIASVSGTHLLTARLGATGVVPQQASGRNLFDESTAQRSRFGEGRFAVVIRLSNLALSVSRIARLYFFFPVRGILGSHDPAFQNRFG